MNVERPDEVDAKQIVEKILGVGLEHADFNGGVDYRSLDHRIALEVTRITDGKKAAGRKALRKSKGSGSADRALQSCWMVFVSETQARMQTFHQEVAPLLSQLEAAGEQVFFGQSAMVRVLKGDQLSDIFRRLVRAGVQQASSMPEPVESKHDHRLIVLAGSGGSSGGSDEALAGITATLSNRIDNHLKLATSGADQRHLFVWLDDDSPFSMARPLSRDVPSWADEGFGLPRTAPELDSSTTHLWVAHERSRLGWFWDGAEWHDVQLAP